MIRKEVAPEKALRLFWGGFRKIPQNEANFL
jgi:hypothetical protein